MVGYLCPTVLTAITALTAALILAYDQFDKRVDDWTKVPLHPAA